MTKKKLKFSRKGLLILVLSLVFVVTLATPTLSRFANLGLLPTNLPVWDGSVASSYESGEGTKDNPYIISTGAQFAYFASELDDTDYKDMYFRLSNDIILNDGYFVYENEIVKYMYSEKEYFLKKYTSTLYEEESLTTKSDLDLNLFSSIKNFAGNLDGSFHSIYGLYLTDEESENLSLFKNLTGEIENVFIENTLIYGKNNVSGIASKTTGSELKNVYVHGNVISEGIVTEGNKTFDITDVNFTTYNENKSFRMFETDYNNEKIVSAKLSGDYVVSDDTDLNYELKIGDEVIPLGHFEVNLNDVLLSDVVISVTADENIRDVSLMNLKYEIVYENSYSSALFNNSNSILINNVVTDVNVFNKINASSFISNSTGKSEINNSYNIGDINGAIKSSGLIGNVSDGELSINKAYNDGLLFSNSYMIGNINSGSVVNVSNTFNNQVGKFIDNNFSEEVILENIYSKEEEEGINPLLDPLSREFFDSLTLGDYNVNDEVNDNVWVYNSNMLPELFYVDEINLVDVRIGNSSWSKLHIPANTEYFNRDVTVAVTSSSYVYTIDKVEYFISTSSIPFAESEVDLIEWTEYENALKLTEDGEYIVYIKITDYSGDARVINTDIIHIDTTNPTATLEFNDTVWDSYRKDVNEVYMEENDSFIINASDSEAGIKEVSYYLTDEIISEKELSNLNDANWTDYQSEFEITPIGNNILYARAIDNSGNISYLNSDIITFDGYHLNYLEPGRNDMFVSGDVVNITTNSSVTANFIFNIPSESLPELNHIIKFNKALPVNTVIVIEDKITGNKYDYKTTTNDVTEIPFALFNLLGTVNTYYTEENYDNGTNIVEDFVITVNFEDSIMVGNLLDVVMSLECTNNLGVVVRETTLSSLKAFNLYYNSDANMYFDSNTTNVSIKSNTDSISNININTGLTYQQASGVNITDTYIEEQDIVLQFRLYDYYGYAVPANKLSNIVLRLDGVEYYPNEEGRYTIELNSGIQQINKNLEIVTYKGDTFLEDGTYSLRMNSFISYTNQRTDYIATKEMAINISKSATGENVVFKAEMNSDPILEKDNGIETIDMTTLLSGVSNPNIKISLYKKVNYNAVDQEYELIDLNEYTTADLTISSMASRYTLNGNNVLFDLDVSLLDRQAYKFIIEAYDGDSLLYTIEKSFIIK